MSAGLSYFLQQSVNGLSLGAIYALIALGYSMVYGLLYLINFAHGDLYVFGTYIAMSCITALSGKIHPIICCLMGAVAAGGIGMIIERLAYRPVRFAHRNVPMISAFGMAAVLSTTAQVVWGPESYAFPSILPEGYWMFGAVQVFKRAVVVVIVALVIVFLVQAMIKYTKLGRGTRCIMQDINTSHLMGVPVNTIIPVIYALGGFLGVVGGVIYSSYYSLITINMGMLGTVKAWAVVTLGGPGSFIGALLGGLILGWSESMAATYISSAARDAVGYLTIIVVLMFRPYGIFGKKKVEKV